MNLEQRISAFATLGAFLQQFSTVTPQKKETIPHNTLFFEGFKHQIKLASEHNGWFTKNNISFSLKTWANLLTQAKLKEWVTPYHINNNTPKTIAIIMAGNIPLVGFHDFLSVLLSGHRVIVKLSSNDRHLLPFLAKYLHYIAPDFKGMITFTEEKLSHFDAVIATGSNNTARYFEYYFRGKPSIIRQNRNTVAVLTGNESEDDLKHLSEDIFRYFGLGCRSVSKLFVPKSYNFDALFKGVYHWHSIIDNAKYANNYDYNKAVYLMSEFDILENGFLMLKEDNNYASPIATIFYSYYDNLKDLKEKLHQDTTKIQCIVSNGFIKREVAFGQTQHPQLHHYADQIDTLAFLSQLNTKLI